MSEAFQLLHSGKPSAVYKNRMARYTDEVWLIWSNKWGCWYRDNCQGYTSNIANAGLYDRETAAKHYVDGPPRHRDCEPFPISSVIGHLRARKLHIQAQAAEKLGRLDMAISHFSAAANPLIPQETRHEG